MALSQRFMWNVDSQIRDLAERKKKRQLFDQDMQRREMREKEKTGALDRKIARGEYESKQANDRTNFFTKMQRDSDAFEVSAGRQDPAYFSAKYGGGAPSGGVSSGGSSTRSGSGTSNQPDYATMLIDAYKAAGDIDGMKEDFLSFSKKVLPQLQKDFPATEQSIDPWELRRKKNAMDYGSRTTKDFQDNMTTARTPEGALRFSDNGVREGDTKLDKNLNPLRPSRRTIRPKSRYLPYINNPAKDWSDTTNISTKDNKERLNLLKQNRLYGNKVKSLRDQGMLEDFSAEALMKNANVPEEDYAKIQNIRKQLPNLDIAKFLDYQYR